MKTIIGLTGKKCSGKSTVANHLVQTLQFTELSFARPLKQCVVEAFGIHPVHVYGTEQDKNAILPGWGVSARQILQVVGTDLFRDHLPKLCPELSNIWLRRMENEMTKHERVVISDVRFPDEAEMIRRYNGILIKIERPNHFFDVTTVDAHASENQDIDSDFTVQNDGTIEKIVSQCQNFIEEYICKLQLN